MKNSLDKFMINPVNYRFVYTILQNESYRSTLRILPTACIHEHTIFQIKHIIRVHGFVRIRNGSDIENNLRPNPNTYYL